MGVFLSKSLEGFLKAVVTILWAIFGMFVVFVFFSLIFVWGRINVEREVVLSNLKEVFNLLGTVAGGIVWATVGLIIAAMFIWFFSSIFPDIIQRVKSVTTLSKKDEAIETLRMRLAKGEITKEEYIEMKKLLEE